MHSPLLRNQHFVLSQSFLRQTRHVSVISMMLLLSFIYVHAGSRPLSDITHHPSCILTRMLTWHHQSPIKPLTEAQHMQFHSLTETRNYSDCSTRISIHTEVEQASLIRARKAAPIGTSMLASELL
ncbi:hypothetical protein HDV63DRAFT_235586 [Trichoderma sp. SZMC 28014]